MSNIVRGYFAESVILFLKSILDIVIWCFSSVPKALISLTLLYLWYRKKRRKVKDLNVGKEIQEMQKDLQKLLNKISRIKGLDIEPSMTLREISGKIEAMNNPGLQPFSMCLKEYESIRYNSSLRDNQSLTGIRKKITEVLKTRI